MEGDTLQLHHIASMDQEKNINTRSTLSRSQPPRWIREMLAELVGTYFLIMIGDCAVANYKLDRKVDHFAVAFTFGVAGMIGIAASMPISGAHLNPAITLAFATTGQIPFAKIPHYFLGQYLGAFLAAATVYLTYFEAINAFDHGERVAWYSIDIYNQTRFYGLATGGIFSTYPAEWISPVGSLIDQVVATFALVFAVQALTHDQLKLPKYLHPFILGMVICGMVVAFGLNCGAVLNPARDLSPRLFQLLAGYGLDTFKPTSSLYWLTADLIGPHLGGILGAWAFQFLIYPEEENENLATNTNIKNGSKSSEDELSKKPFLVVNE